MVDIDYSTMETFIVAIGMGETSPNNQILMNAQSAVERNICTGMTLSHSDVHVRTCMSEADSDQRKELGGRTIHVQQYDILIDTEKSVSESKVRDIVIDTVQKMGFKVTGKQSQHVTGSFQLGE